MGSLLRNLESIGIVVLMITIMFAGIPTASALVYDGLIAHYCLDEGSGITANDLAGDYDGTIYGASWGTGKKGLALSFDGVNDYVDLGSSIGYNIGGNGKSFSIECWTYRASSGAWHSILGHGIYNWPLDNHNLHFGYRGDDRFFMAFYKNDLITSQSFPDTDGWHHWVGTYNGITNERRLYHDGVIVASDIAPYDYLETRGKMYIGAIYWRQWYNNFHGKLDEISIYNRALTADEVFSNYLYSNDPPEAEAGGPYSGSEGSPITFYGGGSWDHELDPLQYRWDFQSDGIWDTAWSTSPTTAYTWYDDHSGTVTLEVSDGTGTDTDTAPVTVNNVIPTVSITSPALGAGELPSDAYAHWDFNEGSGGVAHDSAGSLDAAIYGATWTSGIDGSALSFDGADDYAASPFTTINEMNNGVTAHLRMYLPSDYSGWKWFLAHGGGNWYPYVLWDLRIMDTTLNIRTFYYKGAGGDDPPGNGFDTYSAPGAIPLGEWFDVTAVLWFDSSTYTTRIRGYVNGEEVISEDLYGRHLGNIQYRPLVIGAIAWHNYPYYPPVGNMECTIDDVMIYTRPLTAEEIPKKTQIGPGESINFEGEFTDSGHPDIHTAIWDWGDGSPPEAGIVTEENEYPYSTGDVTGTHTFNIPGVHVVTLTVTDDDGGTGMDTVVITVITHAEATQQLIDTVIDLDLDNAVGNSLLGKLSNAFKSFENGQYISGANQLNAFINELEAQRGKKLTDTEVDNLILEAQRLIDSLT